MRCTEQLATGSKKIFQVADSPGESLGESIGNISNKAFYRNHTIQHFFRHNIEN